MKKKSSRREAKKYGGGDGFKQYLGAVWSSPPHIVHLWWVGVRGGFLESGEGVGPEQKQLVSMCAECCVVTGAKGNREQASKESFSRPPTTTPFVMFTNGPRILPTERSKLAGLHSVCSLRRAKRCFPSERELKSEGRCPIKKSKHAVVVCPLRQRSEI